ncbi:pilus assembly protein [Vibrio parahaemolyticus]|uniref:TadE/TadG family type IV pilus assembly protein n=1 Tax=Vibrio parahaemolyticus TaxID=670 RepID=UPI001EEC47D2|nr:TadE/TadG family type IV pilus assembly protein [Vibrio parahaemolyticus]MCG6461806.1 pilus assembly protein [Vibrio parahaemolyticus]
MRRWQKGSITVEVAMGIPIILIAFFAWVELCTLIYAMGTVDDAFTVGVKNVKKAGSWDSTENYAQDIVNELTNYNSALGTNLIKEDSIDVNVYYFSNVRDLQKCSSSSYENISDCPYYKASSRSNPIALYELNYSYHPMFSSWFPDISLKREIIAIQEFERCNLENEITGCDE